MSKNDLTQSQKRFSESLAQQFTENSTNQQNIENILFLKSSSDIGVMRNFGRNGAKYAPKALLNILKKFTLTPRLKTFQFSELEVSNESLETENFSQSQNIEAQNIESILKNNPHKALYHIGGGHDHIYPLLKSYEALGSREIIVINIDAHADTRIDDIHHSGTPFRQFDNEFQGIFKLYQIGLNRFANSFSTLSPLENGVMKVLWKDQLEDWNLVERFFQEINPSKEAVIIFSLDADCLSGFEVPSVSAVNPSGISLSFLEKLFLLYLGILKNKSPIVGIYELNPTFDTNSSLGLRTIGAFIFSGLNQMK